MERAAAVRRRARLLRAAGRGAPARIAARARAVAGRAGAGRPHARRGARRAAFAGRLHGRRAGRTPARRRPGRGLAAGAVPHAPRGAVIVGRCSVSRPHAAIAARENHPTRPDMCGILGVVARSPVNQLLYDGLLLLQHRGQDAAGIATEQGNSFHMQKGNGLVRDVFRTRNMRSLSGTTGIAHVRYPTAGSAGNSEEAQPFYVNAPFGIMLAHNGNLTNSGQLKDEMFRRDLRHINTDSDSEVLLNVLANSLQASARGVSLDPDTIFAAVGELHARVRGAYA